MKKRFTLSLCLLLCMSLLFVACSSNNNSSSNSSSTNSTSTGGNAAAEAKEKVAIEVWLTPQWKGVVSADEEGADYDSFFKYAAEKFVKQYDKYDATVNVEIVAGDQRDQLLNVKLTGGTPPDIFFESVFAMGDYVHRGAIVPLTDIVDDAAKADIESTYWDAVTFGKEIYFYPFQNNPGTFVYNADMFKAAGLDQYIGDASEIKTWTLDEFQVVLDGLKNNLPKDQYPNASPMGLFAVNNQGDTWNLSYLRMFGNPFFDADGNIVLNDENGIKGAEWMKMLYDNGYTNPGAESVSSNDVNALFANQQVAISFTNPILYSNTLASMESGNTAKFDARIGNIPSASGDPLSFTYITGAALFDTRDEKRMEVAKDFVKFFSTDEELVLSSQNGIPVRSSVVEKVKDTNPLFTAYNENSKYIFNFTGNVPGYSQLREVLYPELQAMYLGQKTPAEAVASYQEKGNAVIQQNKANSVIYQ